MDTRLRSSGAELLAQFETPPQSWWFYFEVFFPTECQGHDFQVGQPNFLLLTRAQQTLKVCQYINGCTLSGGLQSAFYQDTNAALYLSEHVQAFGWDDLASRFKRCLKALVGRGDISAWVESQNAADAHAVRVHEKYWSQESLSEEDQRAYEALEQQEALESSWGNAGLLKNEATFEAFNAWFEKASATPKSRAALRHFVEGNMRELVV